MPLPLPSWPRQLCQGVRPAPARCTCRLHSIRMWLYIARMLDHLGCHTYLDQPEDLEGHGAAAVLMRLHHADLCTAEHASSAKHPPSHCA